MKLRRLDREYQEVQKAEITTDPNEFQGLSKILGTYSGTPEVYEVVADTKDGEAEEDQDDADDGFGDFQDANEDGAYA